MKNHDFEEIDWLDFEEEKPDDGTDCLIQYSGRLEIAPYYEDLPLRTRGDKDPDFCTWDGPGFYNYGRLRNIRYWLPIPPRRLEP